MLSLSFFSVALFILELATAWKVFEKYGEPGWKGLIPFYSDYIEFGKVWSIKVAFVYMVAAFLSVIDISEQGGALGFIAGIASIVTFVINIMLANKKSKAFGKGMGLTLLLIFFPFIGNICIGFNKNVEYIGNTTEE